MNGMNFKPFIHKVINSLSDEEAKAFYDLINSHSNDFEKRSLIKGDITDDDKGVGLYTIQLDSDTIRTGYLIYNTQFCVLLSYVSNSERIVEFELNLDAQTYEVIKEYLTTDYLRHEVAIKAVEVGEIGDLVEIKEVENLPSEGEEDTIYLSDSNIVNPTEGPVNVPKPLAADVGKVLEATADGNYRLGPTIEGAIQADKTLVKVFELVDVDLDAEYPESLLEGIKEGDIVVDAPSGQFFVVQLVDSLYIDLLGVDGTNIRSASLKLQNGVYTVINFLSKNLGTKLYLHTISVSATYGSDNLTGTVKLICDSATPFTSWNDLYVMFGYIVGVNKPPLSIIAGNILYTHKRIDFEIVAFNQGPIIPSFIIKDVNGYREITDLWYSKIYTYQDITLVFGTDTVTEL